MKDTAYSHLSDVAYAQLKNEAYQKLNVFEVYVHEIYSKRVLKNILLMKVEDSGRYFDAGDDAIVRTDLKPQKGDFVIVRFSKTEYRIEPFGMSRCKVRGVIVERIWQDTAPWPKCTCR